MSTANKSFENVSQLQ